MKVLYMQSESHTQSHSDWMVCLPALCFSVFIFTLQLVLAGYSRKIIQESLLYGREMGLIAKRRYRTTSTKLWEGKQKNKGNLFRDTPLATPVIWLLASRFFMSLLFHPLICFPKVFHRPTYTDLESVVWEHDSLFCSVLRRAEPFLCLCPASAHSPACMQGFTGISVPASSSLTARQFRTYKIILLGSGSFPLTHQNKEQCLLVNLR